MESGDEKLAASVIQDYRKAGFDAKTTALCDYAVQLTRAPEKSSQAGIEKLRQLGWSDEQIHDATQIIGMFNYYTRLAHALGVEPEDFMPPEPKKR